MASAPPPRRRITLQRRLALVPITSVAFYASPAGKKYFLAGQDGDVAIYEDAPRRTHDPVFSLSVFEDQPIHGIRVQGSRIVLWGAAELALLDGGPLAEGRRPVLLATATAPDWVYDVAISPVCVDRAVLATAHNEVAVMDYCFSRDQGHISLGTVVSPSRPMLYAAHLAWVSESRVLVAAGTVFGHVVVWEYSISDQEHSVAFVLRGHEGSIYGVDMSPPLLLPDGSRRRLLVSCSDDRTIRIWDISLDLDGAAAPSPRAGARRGEFVETGFEAADRYDVPQADSGREGGPVAVAVAMGHASRIWGVRFAVDPLQRECALDGNALRVYSFGEDSTTQRWGLELGSGTQPGAASAANLTGRLTHQHTYALHHGKHLWARAVDVHARGVDVLTGGADGKVAAIREPARHDDEGDPGSAFITVDVPDGPRCLSQDGRVQGGPSREIFSRYDFLSEDRILAVTNAGRLFVGHLPARTWEQVPVREGIAEDLRRCCVVRKMGHHGGTAVIGTTNGKVYFFHHGDEKQGKGRGQDGLVLAAEVPGRITEINDLSSGPHLVSILVHMHGSTASHLLSLTPAGDAVQRQRLAGLDARFVAVSATTLDDLLILGSRHGYISLLTQQRQHQTWRPILDVATRSRDAITCLVALPAAEGRSSAAPSAPYVLATSRDGKYRIYRVDGGGGGDLAPSLSLLHETSPPFGPMIEGAWFTEGPAPSLILYGFRSKDLVLWNESTGEELAAVNCGGAHRTFRLHGSARDPQRHRFAYTRTSKLCVHTQRTPPARTVRRGTHGREIRALGASARFVASGAEDTCIRIWEYVDDDDDDDEDEQEERGRPATAATMRQLACVKAHVTGLQKLRWLQDEYLFSSGGNEEFFVWRTSKLAGSAYGGLAVVCEGVLTDKSPVGDLRITDFDVSKRGDGQANQRVAVTLGFSNSSLRTYEYEVGRGSFRLLAVGAYTGACITQVRHLGFKGDGNGNGNGNGNELHIMTASTDGHLALWAAVLDGGTGGVQSYVLGAASAVHQGSIKSLDMRREGTRFRVVTGGDDNAVGIVQIAEGQKDGGGTGRGRGRGTGTGTGTGTTTYEFAARAIVGGAHAAAVNGVALLPTSHPHPPHHAHQGPGEGEMLAVSVSNDQRVKVWRIAGDGDGRGAQEVRVSLAACASSAVADVGDVAVACCPAGRPGRLVLGGVGVEVWRVRDSLRLG